MTAGIRCDVRLARRLVAVLTLVVAALPARPGQSALAASPCLGARAVGCTDVVYMLMVDRFANGDPGNDAHVARGDPRASHGGDLAGVLQRLDYLTELGVSALWLSPLYPNPPRGYHGYWPLELRGVDPRFGDLATLRRLVDEAHARGIRVILDHVVNHTAPEHPWRRDPSRRDWYHGRGDVRNWNDPTEVEQGDLFGLPDLNQENPEVAAYLLETARWWLERSGADGLRLDAAKHVSLAFWRRFVAAVRDARPDAFLLAEVYDRNPQRLRPYLEAGFDAAFDFALQAAITETFARARGLVPVRSALAARERAVPGPERLAVILDNHDLPRFLYEAGFHRDPERALARLRAALAFLLTVPGIPVIYYGTETGMTGGPDPYNRADMRFDDHPELRDWTAGLIRLRRGEPTLRGRRLELVPAPGAGRLLAYVRYPEPGNPRARPVLVVIQADDRSSPPASLALPREAAPSESGLRLLYATHAARGPVPRVRPGGGKATVVLPELAPWEARIYRLEPPVLSPPATGFLLGGAAAVLAGLLALAAARAARRRRRAAGAGG